MGGIPYMFFKVCATRMPPISFKSPYTSTIRCLLSLLSICPLPTPNARLVMIEDNDAVIKMLAKGRAPVLKHCSRTQRVDLDFLFEQLKDDPAILCRYIHTSHQIADILTKGVFTAESWCRLCGLLRLGPPPAAPEFIDDAVKSKVKELATHAVSYYANGVLVFSADENLDYN